MKVFGFAGYSGSGKTTLIEQLIPRFVARGLKVSLIKHAHHGFDIDKPGKDSHTHRMAGAREVMISSVNRWALIHELDNEAEPPLDAVLARLSPCDLVIIEGYKREGHDKIEVRRSGARESTPVAASDPSIIAIATDMPDRETKLPQFALDDIKAIVRFVMQRYPLEK